MSFTDKYLSVWILLAIVLGFSLGVVFPDIDKLWQRFNYDGANVLLAVCLVAMMYPPCKSRVFKAWQNFSLLARDDSINHT